MIGSITISSIEYRRLRIAEEILCRLKDGGVDNWQGYSESLNNEEFKSMEEFFQKLNEEIKAVES